MYAILSIVISSVNILVGASVNDDAFCQVSPKFLNERYGPIVYSSVLHRHGDRTPYYLYPKDPYNNYNWENGLGQLTNNGKLRLYKTGEWFRKNYGNLTGRKYSKFKVIIQSSDTDRALMSSQSFLAGFFPPTREEMWHPTLPWQPIPIHGIPIEEDDLLHMSKPCSKYTKIYLELHKLPYFKKLLKKYMDVIDYTEENTGTNYNRTYMQVNLEEFHLLYDALLVEKNNGLKLPAWTAKIFPEPLRTLSVEMFRSLCHTKSMLRMRGGPILKSIRTDLMNWVNGKNELRMHIYSAHDITLITIMMTLDVFNNMLPDYGSLLMFDLRKKKSEYYVTMMFKNCTSEPPYWVQIPGCCEDCTLRKFTRLLQPFIPDDWDKECDNYNNNEDKHQFF